MSWFDEAKELYFEGMGYRKIAKELGLSVKTVESRFLRAKKQNILYEDKRPEPTAEDIRQAYEAYKNLDKVLDKLDTKQTDTIINITDDKPIGIAFWGDWHLGARGVDYNAFDADKDLIQQTDGLYYIGMGDYKDNQNALIHASGVTEQIATPGIQDMLVQHIIEETGDKALALVRGCHDDWDKRLGDKDFIANLCSKADCVNLWHGGSITIKLGQQQYIIRARHKYKGESGLNTTNAQRRFIDDCGPSDVVALAHKHFPDMQTLDRMGQKVTYTRSGAYKVYDEYGQKLAGYKGKRGVPVVVLYPNEHRITPFAELEDAVRYLKAVRE